MLKVMLLQSFGLPRIDRVPRSLHIEDNLNQLLITNSLLHVPVPNLESVQSCIHVLGCRVFLFLRIFRAVPKVCVFFFLSFCHHLKVYCFDCYDLLRITFDF
jgi:hypothetical protein